MFEFLQIVTYAIAGGVIPCLFWLVFWLRESADKPEPAKVVVACFVAGMIMTLVVFPFEYLSTLVVGSNTLIAFLVWSFIEEFGKFIACYFVALRTKNERIPIDAVIYMISVALGFAALENTLYLMGPLSDGDAFVAVITGNLRFIGASLLHTVASATIGVFIAFAFYKKPHLKHEFAFFGILSATLLHTVFNFFILQDSGSQTLFVFAGIWFLAMALIIILEKVKTIKLKSI